MSKINNNNNNGNNNNINDIKKVEEIIDKVNNDSSFDNLDSSNSSLSNLDDVENLSALEQAQKLMEENDFEDDDIFNNDKFNLGLENVKKEEKEENESKNNSDNIIGENDIVNNNDSNNQDNQLNNQRDIYDDDEDDDFLDALNSGQSVEDAIKAATLKNENFDISSDEEDENSSNGKYKRRRDKAKNKKIKKNNDKNYENKGSLNIFKALTEKITGMGYSYNMLSLMKTIFFFSFIIIILGYFHKLHALYIVILIIAFIFMIPFSVYYQYKYLYEQKRFNQLKTYLKFMRLNFKQYKKIIIALKETKENFSEEDQIFDLIQQAINEIEQGTDFRTALDIVEIPFKNSYITKLHSYMILAETEGGSSALDALDTIDFENWEADTYIYQTQKYKYQAQNPLYTIIGMGISLSIIFIFKYMMQDESTMETFGNIFSQLGFQAITFIYILLDLISFIMIKSMITGKWVKEDE